MALIDFREELQAAASILDLAERLGARCLAASTELKDIRTRPQAKRELRILEDFVRQVPLVRWEAAIKKPKSCQRILGADLLIAVRNARPQQPLDSFGVLRGLCRGPLMEYFEVASGQIELTKGLPVRFAGRPLPAAFTGETTTRMETLHDRGLLRELPFDLFTHSPTEEPRVVLDFSVADRLDAITWEEDQRLPLIATLHPQGGGTLAVDRHANDLFFGVHPEVWDIEAIKALLVRAKDAGARVAVLPELSLPSPDALEEMLTDSASSYPEIIVAGSAHVEIPRKKGQRRIRANESRVYLGGERVAIARKQKAFRFHTFAGTKYKNDQWEDLTEEPKTITVLSGRRTRLGVAICADLQEPTIPRLLEDAGVNLLIAPSMTPSIGSFNSPLSGIAGYCQGVAVIANTRWDDTGNPFLCMCAVPRAHSSEQLSTQSGDGRAPAPELAIIDPNKKLPGAIKWLRKGRARRRRQHKAK
jgi:predicted amidohydrolase